MSVVISIKANSFSELFADLFNILSDTSSLTRVEIHRKMVIFSNFDSLSITAQTEEIINRFSFIEFLASPTLMRFGSEAWITKQSDLYQTKLVIDTDGWHPHVNLELSR